MIMGVAALAATLSVWGLTLNRLVKRKLKLSIFLLGGYVLLHLLLLVRPDLSGPGAAADFDASIRPFERLALTAAIANLLIVSLINPLRRDHVREGFPAIVQDAILIGALVVVGTFVFKEQLLTTSAVGAVVVGFALQDTLGNAFAGLAIQSERPFRVGHWIRVGDFEGRVAEVTWRATKMRTKTGNFIVVPNNIIAKEAITNFSEPAMPTRLAVNVGVSYGAAPEAVKAAMHEAMRQAPCVLRAPAPEVLLIGFGGSSMDYRAHFWIDDYEEDDRARDQVQLAIHYAFGRHNIEIPYPIQVEYSREWPAADAEAMQREREEALRLVDIFASLTGEQRAALARETETRKYGGGEAVVREGEPGDSMYVVCSGKVSVLVAPDRREVATIEKGGYFGEMSLLTGEPRTATVVASGEAVVLELTARQFRALGSESPEAVERIGLAAVTRRAELDRVRLVARGAAAGDAPANFLARMKKFLRLR